MNIDTHSKISGNFVSTNPLKCVGCTNINLKLSEILNKLTSIENRLTSIEKEVGLVSKHVPFVDNLANSGVVSAVKSLNSVLKSVPLLWTGSEEEVVNTISYTPPLYEITDDDI